MPPQLCHKILPYRHLSLETITLLPKSLKRFVFKLGSNHTTQTLGTTRTTFDYSPTLEAPPFFTISEWRWEIDARLSHRKQTLTGTDFELEEVKLKDQKSNNLGTFKDFLSLLLTLKTKFSLLHVNQRVLLFSMRDTERSVIAVPLLVSCMWQIYLRDIDFNRVRFGSKRFSRSFVQCVWFSSRTIFYPRKESLAKKIYWEKFTWTYSKPSDTKQCFVIRFYWSNFSNAAPLLGRKNKAKCEVGCCQPRSYISYHFRCQNFGKCQSSPFALIF